MKKNIKELLEKSKGVGVGDPEIISELDAQIIRRSGISNLLDILGDQRAQVRHLADNAFNTGNTDVYLKHLAVLKSIDIELAEGRAELVALRAEYKRLMKLAQAPEEGGRHE